MIILKAFRLALSFLTRIPVGRQGVIGEREWRWMACGFPFCGYVLAALALLLPAAVLKPDGRSALSSLLVACVTVSLLAYLTRGLHLDGMADMCDAYGGGANRERRLEILKDPCVGSFGVLGLVLLLAMKIAALAMLLGAGRALAAGAVVVMSRFFLALLNAISTYARKEGKAVHVVGKVAPGAILVAAACAAPCCFVPGVVLTIPAMGAVMLILKRQADRELGGMTGDILGACCELCETVGYVILALQVGAL
jgi:adenosylcobinamide-GDP ribazoletransferase